MSSEDVMEVVEDTQQPIINNIDSQIQSQDNQVIESQEVEPQTESQEEQNDDEEFDRQKISELATGLDVSSWGGLDVMKSLCMSCGEEGITRYLLHKIPFFKELILASFYCRHCGERNNEISFGGEIQLHGAVIRLEVRDPKDLDRQFVKSDSASIRFVELDLEIPPMTQKGEINTLEGIIRNCIRNLSLHQRERMMDNPEVGQKVSEIILELSRMADGESIPFTVELDDPAGNSFIQNFLAPRPDEQLSTKYYVRTADQDRALGLDPEKATYKSDESTGYRDLINGPGFGHARNEDGTLVNFDSGVLGREAPISIPSPCPSCYHNGEFHTVITNIPHFKEVIIMAFACQICGFRTNDVKGGGAIPTLGTEMTLAVESPEDLKRDVLKSDSASVRIPEIDLTLDHGSLGGMFTTVEGLLKKIYKNLDDSNPFAAGDSSTKHHSGSTELIDTRQEFLQFLQKIDRLIQGKSFPFTIVIRDPLGNSFISARLGSFLPPEADEQIKMVDFERSFEENEDFGLNDINTQDFETGYEDKISGPILPDRLTIKHVQGPDHPTPFAKGTYENDYTEGSIPVDKITKISADQVATSNTSSQNIGLVAQRAPEDDPYFTVTSIKAFSQPAQLSQAFEISNKLGDDSALKCIHYEEFSGPREGYVFRMGSQGIGYYEDIKPVVNLEGLDL